MADVLITPASGKIEFKDGSNNVDGKIELDGSGNLNITSPGGDIAIGDTTADVYIGDGVNNIDVIFEQAGAIRGATGVTLTVGSSDSNVKIGTINYPVADGTNGQVLTTNGSGTATWADAGGGLDETTATTSSTTQTSIASYSTTTYGTAKLLVTVKRGTARQISELLIAHDGTTAYATEYAIINTGTELATFDVDISGGNFRLLATATSATSTNYTVTEILVGA